MFGAAAAGAVLAIVRPRTPIVRLLGAVTVAGGIAYLFTPLTAAGPQDQPLAFGINLRYLVPALALGLALVPLEPKLTPERARLPLLAGGAVAMLVTSLYSDSAYIWSEPFASIPIAALIGIAFIGLPVGLALLGRRSVALAAAAGAAAALVAGGVGWERSDDYLDARYTGAEDLRFQLDDVAAWAKDTSAERIGVAGLSGAYNQYILYGDELSNHVQYLGRDLPAGDFRTIERCPEFIREVNDGDYSYVVTTPELDLNAPDTAQVSPEGGWMRGAGADEVLRAGRVSIFRIDGQLAGCGVVSAGEYILGMAALAAVALSVAVTGRTLRRALLPGWSGAPALLAAGVLALGVLIAISELLGLFGLLDGVLLTAACVIAGAGALRIEPMLKAGGGDQREAKEGPQWEFVAAVLFAFVVAVQWAGPTMLALDRGIYGGDSLWYHMPFAAHIAATGSVTDLLFTDPLYLNWLYPQNSELLHADGLMLLGDDFISPLLNLGWLAAALFAAWCIGRPYGAGGPAVGAVAAIMSANLLFSRQPGNANNDVVAIALLLASVAILVNARTATARGPLLVAGLAAGLALGTKLTIVPPVGALTIGVVVIAASGERARAAGAWLAGLFAGGGLWYVRDLIASGTPFPFVDIGPLTKPEELQGRDPFSVAHYLTDTDIWGRYFRPGLEERLGRPLAARPPRRRRRRRGLDVAGRAARAHARGRRRRVRPRLSGDAARGIGPRGDARRVPAEHPLPGARARPGARPRGAAPAPSEGRVAAKVAGRRGGPVRGPDRCRGPCRGRGAGADRRRTDPRSRCCSHSAWSPCPSGLVVLSRRGALAPGRGGRRTGPDSRPPGARQVRPRRLPGCPLLDRRRRLPGRRAAGARAGAGPRPGVRVGTRPRGGREDRACREPPAPSSSTGSGVRTRPTR